MKSDSLLYRYAKAFLELSIQNNIVDKSVSDLLLIKTAIDDNKELNSIIDSPFVSKERKKNILIRLFENRVEPVTLDFISLVVAKNRISILSLIYDKYFEIYNDYKKNAVVTVISAVSLDKVTTDRIINIMKHKISDMNSIVVNNVIDKSIIGGFIVKYKDYEYDASVRYNLKRLHSVFEENLFVKEY